MASEMKLLRTYDVFDHEVLTEVVPATTITDADGKVVDVPSKKRILMKGILQKADVLNQNGRIYPRHILDREVRNYQKFITENRAVGECVPPGTEIYTRDGWKAIETIVDDEVIATLNVPKNELQFQRIEAKIDMSYVGPMYRFKNARSYDMCLTPNHKVLLWDRAGLPKKVTAQELYDGFMNNDSALSHSGLRRAGVEWKGEDLHTESYSRGMALDFKFMNVSVEPYEGRVYCVNVKNGTWLMRYNGKVCWTGNCDHPDSSVVNLKNVSHIVREAHMDEQGVVHGTVELLDTPSGQILQKLVEAKVKLGISSRGVGSTKKQGDYQVVQDDFQIICWDYVSEPSTSGAFMIPEGKSITSNELQAIFNRSDRIDRVLNDIISSKGAK